MDAMKKINFTPLLILCILLTACSHSLVESEYYFEGKKITRKDWDNVLTELKYYDNNGIEMGSALFYYPGRDGWFLVDNIWDTDKIYLLLCDASPKIQIIDSVHFIVLHDIGPLQHIDKSRWIRMSNKDDIPIVLKQNKEYNSKIIKTNKIKQNCSDVPDWDMFPGEFFKE